MFKNVLIGVDGSANGRDAIALARELADTDAKLTLAHVYRGELDPLNAVQDTLLNADREASSKLLDDERAATGVSAELQSVVALSPAAGLHRQAESQGADLLIVGSCRHGAAGRAMLGDDARASLNGASCAVAIASHGYAEESAPIARIGVAYDGSPESEAALETARTLGASAGASVQVREAVFIPTIAYSGFIAVNVGNSIEEMVNEADRRIDEIPGVTGKAVFGPPDEELEAFSNDVDLLLVGSRSYGPVKRLILGSTSNYLARHAGCCLLVLPRVASEKDGASELGQSAGRRHAASPVS